MRIKRDAFPQCLFQFLAHCLFRNVEAKCFKLKSDLQILPRMAKQLTFEINWLSFIKLIFSGNSLEYIDSAFHTTWGMWCFYSYLFKNLSWMQEKKKSRMVHLRSLSKKISYGMLIRNISSQFSWASILFHLFFPSFSHFKMRIFLLFKRNGKKNSNHKTERQINQMNRSETDDKINT